MPFDVDELLAQFGGGEQQTAKPQGLDVDALLKEFGGSGNTAKLEQAPKERLYITPGRVPTSGDEPGLAPTESKKPQDAKGIVDRITENLRGATNQAGEGVNEILSGKPATGVGNIGLGTLGVVGAIPSAALTQYVENPTDAVFGANPTKQVNLFRPGDLTSFSPSGYISDKDVQTATPGQRVSTALGFGLPVKSAAKAVVPNLPENKALSILVDKITSNGRDPQALFDTINQMKANPRVAPVDTSPAVLNMAQKLFTTEGDAAKNYLYNASKARKDTSADAVEGAYNSAVGVPVNVVQKLTDLANASKKVGTEQINPALKAAKPVDVTNTINNIDKILKPGVFKGIEGSPESTLPLTNIKKELTGIRQFLANKKEQRISAEEIHSFQSRLRVASEDLKNSSNGSERQLGYALGKVRNDLVNDIDTATGGKYKPALSNYRDEKDIADSFRQGYEGVLSNSKKMENMPEFTEQWFKGLSDNEKEAVKEGLRLRVKTEMGTAHNPALAGEKLGRSDFNQAKMESIIGKDETEKLLGSLEQERAIANSHNKIIEGSQTEMRRAGDESIALSKDKPQQSPLGKYVLPAAMTAAEAANTYLTGGSTFGLGALLSASAVGAGKAGSIAKAKIVDMLEKERNMNLAKMALPTEPEARAQLIQQLEAVANHSKPSLLQRALPVARMIAP